MSYSATVPLGAWNATSSAWACDLAGYSGAVIAALHVDDKVAPKASWEQSGRVIRWIGAPPTDPARAWVEVSLAQRMDTARLVAIIGVIGSLGGAAIGAGVSIYTSTCGGDLAAARAEVVSKQKQNEKQTREVTTCKDSLGDVTGLCQ